MEIFCESFLLLKFYLNTLNLLLNKIFFLSQILIKLCIFMYISIFIYLSFPHTYYFYTYLLKFSFFTILHFFVYFS